MSTEHQQLLDRQSVLLPSRFMQPPTTLGLFDPSLMKAEAALRLSRRALQELLRVVESGGADFELVRKG